MPAKAKTSSEVSAAIKKAFEAEIMALGPNLFPENWPDPLNRSLLEGPLTVTLLIAFETGTFQLCLSVYNLPQHSTEDTCHHTAHRHGNFLKILTATECFNSFTHFHQEKFGSRMKYRRKLATAWVYGLFVTPMLPRDYQLRAPKIKGV